MISYPDVGRKTVERIYTPQEVAEQLQLPIQTIWLYLRTGRLSGAKIGKHWRIRETELAAFVAPSAGDRPEGYRQQLERALALAEELTPVIRAGTTQETEASEVLDALRRERQQDLGCP